MDFNLSNTVKKDMANQALFNLEASLYRELITVGLNPDTFDIHTFSQSNDPDDAIKYQALVKIIEKIASVTEVIESL
jgi:hypothetical protein